MQEVKDAIARANGPEGDGAASYQRLITEARNLFQDLPAEEQQNLLANLSEDDRRTLEGGQGGKRRKSRKSKKSRRRRHTRRHR